MSAKSLTITKFLEDVLGSENIDRFLETIRRIKNGEKILMINYGTTPGGKSTVVQIMKEIMTYNVYPTLDKFRKESFVSEFAYHLRIMDRRGPRDFASFYSSLVSQEQVKEILKRTSIVIECESEDDLKNLIGFEYSNELEPVIFHYNSYFTYRQFGNGRKKALDLDDEIERLANELLEVYDPFK